MISVCYALGFFLFVGKEGVHEAYGEADIAKRVCVQKKRYRNQKDVSPTRFERITFRSGVAVKLLEYETSGLRRQCNLQRATVAPEAQLGTSLALFCLGEVVEGNCIQKRGVGHEKSS